MPTSVALRASLLAALAALGSSVKATAGTREMTRVHVGARGAGVLVAGDEREEGGAATVPTLQTPEEFARDYVRRDFDLDLGAEVDTARMDRDMAISKVRARVERLLEQVEGRRGRLNSTAEVHEALKENLTTARKAAKEASESIQRKTEDAEAAQKKFEKAVAEAEKLREEYNAIAKVAKEANATLQVANATVPAWQARAEQLKLEQQGLQRRLKKVAEKREAAAQALAEAEEQLAKARANLRSLQGHSTRSVPPLPCLLLSAMATITAWRA